MKLVDTHSHLIPYCDDGSEDWNMSLRMLEQAREDGITDIVCTPHIFSNNDLDDEYKFVKLFKELVARKQDAEIPINLYLGSELYVQPNFRFDKDMTTLAQNGRYFLIEFPMAMIPSFVARHFFQSLPLDKTPVIAHPERNGSIVRNPQNAIELVKNGALLQVTAGSLLGGFGQQVQTVAHTLLQANAAHLIATDAHDDQSRTLQLRQAYNLVKNMWGEERARILFNENPLRIIKGDLIEYHEPESISSRNKSMFSRIKSLLKS
ncbi:MAG: CpsB/CapC family capsule biosynthesis tyrosine phosphatase [candidate division KSB1 bacterium]|nr:CpsB/CapC family capsule biosynthesis tyrosine phosphatase [candidate division KSB1 bacterium]